VIRQTDFELNDSTNKRELGVQPRKIEIGDPKQDQTAEESVSVDTSFVQRQGKVKLVERQIATYQSFQSHWNEKLLRCKLNQSAVLLTHSTSIPWSNAAYSLLAHFPTGGATVLGLSLQSSVRRLV
jgi:hypothetical protein